MECVNADIEGSFNGELLVSDLLSLKSAAVIEGTVFVSKLSVEPGATFNASCSMKGKNALNGRETVTQEPKGNPATAAKPMERAKTS